MNTITSLSKLDLRLVRDALPVLHQNVNGYPLVYLDNAATTQKPKTVIHALSEYYQKYNANIHGRPAPEYCTEKKNCLRECRPIRVAVR